MWFQHRIVFAYPEKIKQFQRCQQQVLNHQSSFDFDPLICADDVLRKKEVLKHCPVLFNLSI